MPKLSLLRLVITISALAVALIHLLLPSLQIDAITLSLIVIALLPWLAPLIKSVELPGGVKVELQEMHDVTEKAKEAGLLTFSRASAEHSFQLIADRDPNLALAGLRIEIERRLVRLSEENSVGLKTRSISHLLRSLDERGLVTQEQRAALSDMIGLLNSAVHGATVDPKAADWAMQIAPELLESLDRLIEPTGPKVFVQDDEPVFAHDGDMWVQPDSDESVEENKKRR